MSKPLSCLGAVIIGLGSLIAAGCARESADAPPADVHATATTAPAAASPQAASGPGAWFATTGCTKCHQVSVYGLKSETNIGPDLSIAAEDVESRFGVPLEQFLAEPSGTMAIVLATQIQLTPEQKQVAIAKLHEAHDLYLKQQNASARTGAAAGTQ